jgi:hypothetical protein
MNSIMNFSFKTLSLTCAFIFITKFASGQSSNDYILWSSTRKITADDFEIKLKKLESTPSFAQFTVDYQVNGFDFMTKNFNKKVRNYFLRSASWIDTTTNLQQSLTYHQTLFDICEIYTRHFRKALKENRRKIANGTKIAEELNNQIMTDFAKRRIDYDRETNFASDSNKQKEWEIQIQRELSELSDFAYDK